jgi:hypothetical protein
MGLYGRYLYPHLNSCMNRYAGKIPLLVDVHEPLRRQDSAAR